MNKLLSIVKSQWSIVLLILIIAAFLRLYNITELPAGLYPDEAIYANNGVEAWETGNFKIFYPENYGREGLWPNIIGFFVIKFGHEPWVPRSVAAVFGILTVLGVYFLARELFTYENTKIYESTKYKIALLSSFLMATSFWHINFSRIGFRAIMAPFFLVWGLFFLLKSLNQTKNNFQFSIFNFQTNLKFIIPAVFGGIFYGLGFHSYIAYRATPILIFIIFVLYWFKIKHETDTKQNMKQTQNKFFLVICLFSLVTLLVFAPLGLYFLQNPQDFFGRTTQISVFNSPAPIKDLTVNVLKTAGMFNLSGDFNWRHNYTGRPELFWPVGILFIIGIILGILNFLKAPNHKHQITNNNQNLNDQNSKPFGIWDLGFGVLFAWLIVAALPVIISNEGQPHALRSILMAPAVFILAGIGGLWLYEFIKSRMLNRETDAKPYAKLTRKIILLSTFCFLLSILVFEAYNTYFIKWGQNPNVRAAFSADYVQISRELNSLPKETPKYVVVEASGVLARGIPMPAQTVMFITDTFTPEKQKEKNIHYVLPNQKDKIPENSYVVFLK